MKTMKLHVLSVVMILAMVLSASLAAASSNWALTKGSKLGDDFAPFTAVDTAAGIEIKGSGGYDSTTGNAAGVILNDALDGNRFSVELKVSEIAGMRNQGADHWFNVNLLNRPHYFKLDDTGLAEGLNLFLRPYSESKVDVEVYLISKADGWVGIGGSQVDWSNNTLKVEYNAADASLKVNGTAIEGDFSKVFGLFENGKAYFSTGASNSGEASYGYTVTALNGSPVSLAGGAPAANAGGSSDGAGAGATDGAGAGSESGTSAPAAANPKTSDNGVMPYAFLAVAALAGLLLFGSRKLLHNR